MALTERREAEELIYGTNGFVFFGTSGHEALISKIEAILVENRQMRARLKAIDDAQRTAVY